jgi:hypothetical protein
METRRNGMGPSSGVFGAGKNKGRPGAQVS